MLCDTYVTPVENVYHSQKGAQGALLEGRPWTGSTGHMHTHPLLVNAGVGGPCRDAPDGGFYAHPSRTRLSSVYKLYIPSKVSKEPRPGVGAFCLQWSVSFVAKALGKCSLNDLCIEVL